MELTEEISEKCSWMQLEDAIAVLQDAYTIKKNK